MYSQNNDLTEFLVKIGATIIGVKPSELLNIEINNLDLTKKKITQYPYLEYKEIRLLKKLPRMQMLFYHRQSLEMILKKKYNLRFLQQLGYPQVFNLEKYVDILTWKLRSGVFPHEIGVFLGYPLKDVYGYMGKYPLKLVGTKGWRYYGNEKLSQLQYQKFVAARELFKKILNP
ncbi:DUF3793 family protein [Bacillota bacterium LX-D]|nr:DUF3793 family protein [Bacillota bacterium LX-D]